MVVVAESKFHGLCPRCHTVLHMSSRRHILTKKHYYYDARCSNCGLECELLYQSDRLVGHFFYTDKFDVNFQENALVRFTDFIVHSEPSDVAKFFTTLRGHLLYRKSLTK